MATRRSPPKKAADAPIPAESAEATTDAAEEPAEHSHPESATTEHTSMVQVKHESKGGDHSPRFHFFLIDSGWKSTAAQVIRDNFHMIREFQNEDPLYVLTKEQSIKLIRANPDLIGKDPMLLVHDMHAKGGSGKAGYHGFRLCLGLIKDSKQALNGLQEFLRFIHSHRRSADIERDIKEKLHRKGLEGAIEVLRSGAQELVGG